MYFTKETHEPLLFSHQLQNCGCVKYIVTTEVTMLITKGLCVIHKIFSRVLLFAENEMVSYSHQQTGLNPLPLTTSIKWLKENS